VINRVEYGKEERKYKKEIGHLIVVDSSTTF
jgi:hypothetical protein